ncbi:protein odr-4 homolog [Branchiostoma floridae]|uniref:Protein odr-4 homolog n=1 Tax=Branchiostoma floridae TaxID=7739 RepID=A0A9J7LM97_BRAFL|nr:protein odr-4 homolog [Branchiostoma floridae]
MGRTVIAEDLLQDRIQEILKTSGKGITTGLLVGQPHGQKREDYVVHLIRTPQIEEDSQQAGKKKKKGSTKPEGLDSQWIAEHAKQVQRMLPGGLNILGIFVVLPSEESRSIQSQLVQVLYTVHKTLLKTPWQKAVRTGGEEEEEQHRIVLQICSVTKKFTTKTFNVVDPRDSGTVAEWKFQSFVSQWPLLHTAVTVNINIPVLRGEATKTLHQQLDTSIGPFCECIMQGLCTFNGVLRKGDQPLQAQEPPQGKKGHGKGKGRHKESKTSHQPTSDGPEMFCVQILSKATNNKSKEAMVTECGGTVFIRGLIQARAYVHSKATVAQASQAIREDVVRSLTARCELLAEDVLEVKDFTADREEMDITPRRVFGQLYDTHLSVCDYMFEDEGVEDCIARCQELLDISLAPDDVENDAERLPEPEELEKPLCDMLGEEEEEDTDGEEVVNAQASWEKWKKSYIGTMIGAGIAVVVSGFFMYLEY